jgi:hypothetical protein
MQRPPARDATIAQTLISGLVLVALLLAGYVAMPPEPPWTESYTIRQEGRCQLQCVRYGTRTKCKEYRC